MRCVSILLAIIMLAAGCVPEQEPIKEQSCKSDKPVPMNCIRFVADDVAQRLTFYLRQVDPITIDKTTFEIEGVLGCTSRSVKLLRADYELVFDCKDDSWVNQDLGGTLSFDYAFLQNTLHTNITFTRLFGTYDPIYDRPPLDGGVS